MQRKWKVLITLCAIGGLNYADRTAISSVFPLLQADLHLSDVMLAGIGTVFLWTYGICSPLAGHLADRTSRARLVLIGLVAWSIATALTGLVHSGPALLMTRVLLGIAECAYLPASVALIADFHEPDTRATAMGYQSAAMNIGLIAGSGIAGYLGERIGWRLDFLCLGGAGLVLAFVARSFLTDAPRIITAANSQPHWHGVVRLLKTPAYLAVILAAMLMSVGTWVFLNWLPLYFYDRFHLSLALAGLSGTSVLQIAAIVGVILGGYISDRVARGLPQRRILLLAMGYFLAAPFLLSFLLKLSLGPVNTAIFLYSFIAAIGQANESPLISELSDPNLRATALGILNMLNCFAGGLGILWAGFIKRDHSLSTAFAGLAATVACAGLVVLCGYLFCVRRQSFRPALHDGTFAVSEDPGS